MNLRELKSELTLDPEGIGYAGMTDAQAADALNLVNRVAELEEVSSAWIFERIDATEFQAKTDAEKARVDRVLGLGEGIRIAPGSKARSELLTVFGGASTTVQTFAADAQYLVSRATELMFPFIYEADVAAARNTPGLDPL